VKLLLELLNCVGPARSNVSFRVPDGFHRCPISGNFFVSNNSSISRVSNRSFFSCAESIDLAKRQPSISNTVLCSADSPVHTSISTHRHGVFSVRMDSNNWVCSAKNNAFGHESRTFQDLKYLRFTEGLLKASSELMKKFIKEFLSHVLDVYWT
jgi:hypothetical protein